MKIGIIGTGYVGLIQAVGLAKLGFDIISLDIDENKINDLKNGKAVIYEPGLEKLLKEVSNNINFTTNYRDLNSCDIVFIAVGTPQDKRGRTNKDFIHKASISIKQNLEKGKIIVIKSTVPVGTNKEVKDILGEGYDVVSNPEFLREGKALEDFFNPDRVVVGFENNVNPRVKEKIKTMYDYFIKNNISYIETNWQTAELIKYAANSFLATKISFINELARLSDKVGADIKEIALGMGLDKRIGTSFLNAGLGYGGSCFPKDVKSLIHQFKENGVEPSIVESVDKVNQTQLLYFLSKIEDFYDDLKGKNFLILGLAFKPDTDDLRESRAIKIAKFLKEKGANIFGYDLLDKARDNTKLFYPDLMSIIDNLDSFDFSNIDGIIIATEYKQFNDLNWEKIKQSISMPVIFDGRNILDKENIRKNGFIYKGVGI